MFFHRHRWPIITEDSWWLLVIIDDYLPLATDNRSSILFCLHSCILKSSKRGPTDELDTNFQTPVMVRPDQRVHMRSGKRLCSLLHPLWISYCEDTRGRRRLSRSSRENTLMEKVRRSLEKTKCFLSGNSKKPESRVTLSLQRRGIKVPGPAERPAG